MDELVAANSTVGVHYGWDCYTISIYGDKGDLVYLDEGDVRLDDEDNGGIQLVEETTNEMVTCYSKDIGEKRLCNMIRICIFLLLKKILK